MVISRILTHPSKAIKSINKNSISVLEGLNEIKKENIVQLVATCNMLGIMNYVVFYEDENIYTCPKCGHDISNTFTYCPNCATKLK